MNKKKILASMAAAVVITSGILPTVSSAEENNTSNKIVQNAEVSPVTIEKLHSDYQIVDASIEGLIRTNVYEKNGEQHIVVFDGVTGNVKIDNVIQEDLSYEYDPIAANKRNNPVEKDNPIMRAAAPKAGYKYVGTLTGHTKEAKNAAALGSTLATTIPGLGWGAKVAIILTGYKANERIPSCYYSYDLYQKGFMTNNWYQYSTTRLYKDSKRTKQMGQAWTSQPQKIYLPNS
ncbi:hypothetical protein QCI44_30460 [Bacillus cereus group sp. RP37]|uniref:hypothetical protein n=1 Tax=Bacillus cereus group sp. RP37 TaxID=3040259 RepID=UPI003390D90A